MLQSMTAKEKLEMINNGLANGKNVYIQSYRRVSKITPIIASAWAKSGKPFFKVDGDHLLMIEYNKYVSANFCGITVK